MNKSKYINPEKCRACGECCKSFSICYPKELKKQDPIMFSEVQRFKLLETDSIQVIEKLDMFLVKFNFPCKFLRCEEGVYSCLAYNDNDRPKLCEEYPFERTLDCPHKFKEIDKDGKI